MQYGRLRNGKIDVADVVVVACKTVHVLCSAVKHRTGWTNKCFAVEVVVDCTAHNNGKLPIVLVAVHSAEVGLVDPELRRHIAFVA